MDKHITANEVVTVMVSPYQIARGDLVKRGPQPNEATIRVGNALVRGKCLTASWVKPSFESAHLACA